MNLRCTLIVRVPVSITRGGSTTLGRAGPSRVRVLATSLDLLLEVEVEDGPFLTMMGEKHGAWGLITIDLRHTSGGRDAGGYRVSANERKLQAADTRIYTS